MTVSVVLHLVVRLGEVHKIISGEVKFLKKTTLFCSFWPKAGKMEGTPTSIGHLLREATQRWLKGREVLHVLRNYRDQGYRHDTDVVQCPPSTPNHTIIVVFISE